MGYIVIQIKLIIKSTIDTNDMSNFIDVIYIQEIISVLNQSTTNHNFEGCFDVFEPIHFRPDYSCCYGLQTWML